MIGLLSLVLLVILVLLLLHYFFTQKTSGLIKNFLIKFAAIVLTIICVYLFIRLFRFII